ncbi:hypothetical protein O6H91_06G091400 [Diphasiastrum complanatum]|uniref:Uncharacterized protein n=1 Tax=Diphasiastrum complanatum TaxID=34168 RepID=A0ACC2DGC8_DIPCM|nr:hypothetical protein O6H91_06G091400 [Diphasiastrum complanatum]
MAAATASPNEGWKAAPASCRIGRASQEGPTVCNRFPRARQPAGRLVQATISYIQEEALQYSRTKHSDIQEENCDNRNRNDAQVDDLEEASVNRFTNDLPEWGGNKEIPISPIMDIDFVTEGKLKENAFRSARRTILVCTIGPSCSSSEQLEALAIGGMNVARINMCHGTKEWHQSVIRRIKMLNQEKEYFVTLMMDTEGSEIHLGDLGGAQSSKAEVLPLLLSVSMCVASRWQHQR